VDEAVRPYGAYTNSMFFFVMLIVNFYFIKKNQKRSLKRNNKNKLALHESIKREVTLREHRRNYNGTSKFGT